MRSRRSARAAAVLEQLDRQVITLDRMELLADRTRELLAAGLTHADIETRRDQMNALVGDGVRYDFNDALLVLYDETFASPTRREEG